MAKKQIMLVVHRPDGSTNFVPCESVEEAAQVIQIARLLGNRDVNGTPVTFEVVEYEDRPL